MCSPHTCVRASLERCHLLLLSGSLIKIPRERDEQPFAFSAQNLVTVLRGFVLAWLSLRGCIVDQRGAVDRPCSAFEMERSVCNGRYSALILLTVVVEKQMGLRGCNMWPILVY